MDKKSIVVISAAVILAAATVFMVGFLVQEKSGDVYKLESIMGFNVDWFGYNEDMMVVTLYPGGRVSVIYDGVKADAASWKKDGKQITIYVDREEIRGTLIDDTLTLNIEGADTVLKKQ